MTTNEKVGLGMLLSLMIALIIGTIIFETIKNGWLSGISIIIAIAWLIGGVYFLVKDDIR